MKKWLILILLLIVAAGTFVPCCGANDCCADQVANTNHDKRQNEGTCSPFFACATCPGAVELTKAIQLAETPIEKVVHHQTIVKVNLPTYSSSFWQPPRFC